MESLLIRRAHTIRIATSFAWPYSAVAKRKSSCGARAPLRAGFTLIELMVVLAIIVVVTGIALTSQSSFNRTLILVNTAYDLGLTFRSAETYGIGTRAVGSGANAGYGLHFQQGFPNSFIFFSDTSPSAANALNACHYMSDPTRPDARPGDCVYQSSELITTYTLNNSIHIVDFCALAGSGWTCTGNGLNSLDIVFARPNPDPFIRLNGAYNQSASAACITLAPASGTERRYVSVAASGEIDPHATSCP